MFLEKGVGENKRWFYPISSFLLGLGLSIGGTWTIFYPYIQQHFSLTEVANLCLAFPFIGVGSMVLGPTTAGLIIDKYGPKIPSIIAAVSAVSGYFLIARMLTVDSWSSAMPLWYTGSFFVGFGLGIYGGTYSTTLAKWFPDKTGVVTGIGGAGHLAASIVWSPLIAFMIKTSGFNKNIFILIAVVAFVMFLVIIIFWKNPTHSVTLDFLKKRNEKLLDKFSTPSRDFTLREASRHSYFWILYTGFLCASFAMSFFMQNVSLLIIEGLETTMGREQALAVVIPTFLILVGIAGSIGSFGWGFIIDKLGGPWRTLPILYFSSGLLILLFFLSYSNVALIFIVGFLLYLAMQGEPTAHYAAVSYAFGRKNLGRIMTTIQAFSVGIGISTGPFVGAYIKDVTKGYFWAIMIAVGLRMVATTVSLIGLRMHKKNRFSAPVDNNSIV